MNVEIWESIPTQKEMIEWTGNNRCEIEIFVGIKLNCSVPPMQMQYDKECPNEAFTIIIPTLEGNHTAIRGDYIVKGVHGEFYPIKKEILLKTYKRIK